MNAREYLVKDELTRSSAVMLAAMTLAGVLNYLYQIYMGRVLGVEDFGVFGALFAIFYMIMVISKTLATSASSFVSIFIGEGKHIGFFLIGSLKRMAIFGVAVSVVFIAFSGGLASLLKLPDREPVLILALILFLTWISSISIGALRGVKRFFALGFVNVSDSLFKLIIGMILVTIGFGVAGALAGVASGMLIALLISLYFLKPYIKKNNPHDPDFNYSSFYSYSLPVLLAMFSLSVPSNVDVVLAKYYFSSIDAGLYTSVSVLGKIIIFIPTSIYIVMFPMIVEGHAMRMNTISILKKSLLFTAFLSGSVAVLYYIFPRFLIIAFGESYALALPLLAPYGLAMFFFSLTAVVMHYHLAVKNMKYIAFFAGFTLFEILLLAIFHSSMQEMVEVLLAANLVLLTMSLFYTWMPSVALNSNLKNLVVKIRK